MRLRKAIIQDSNIIAQCLFLAMKEIVFYYIGAEDESEAHTFLETLARQKGNQFSYENCWVLENDENLVVAASNIYDGANLYTLREPVFELARELYQSNLDKVGDETQTGEMYIDCIAVLPEHQGTGYGSILLKHLIDELVIQRGLTLGLLVDLDNPNAHRLYERLGFQAKGKKLFAGKWLEHMQIHSSPDFSRE